MPSVSILNMSEETVKPVRPGILTDMMSHLSGKAQNYIFEIDGKKINRGRGKNIGDIDLWDWESKPTLLDIRCCKLFSKAAGY